VRAHARLYFRRRWTPTWSMALWRVRWKPSRPPPGAMLMSRYAHMWVWRERGWMLLSFYHVTTSCLRNFFVVFKREKISRTVITRWCLLFNDECECLWRWLWMLLLFIVNAFFVDTFVEWAFDLDCPSSIHSLMVN